MAAVCLGEHGSCGAPDNPYPQVTPEKRRAWRRVSSLEAFANEGLMLSRRYAFLKSTDHVNSSYEASRWPIVKEQLQKAGVRLAAVLERALAR